MKTLQASRIKPNPAGKDHNKYGSPSASQLGGEWIDIRNTGNAAVSMANVKLYHIAFHDGKPSHWERLASFTGTLGVGEVIRLHAGRGPLTALTMADRSGATYHAFTGHDQYAWNNAEGDASRITEPSANGEIEVDRASYDPHPGEGVILVRSGTKFVPAGLYGLVGAR